MNIILQFVLLQAKTNYEDLGLKSALVLTIIALFGVVSYLYKGKEKIIKEKDEQMASAIREKDAQIMSVIKDHQDDLKAENQTMKDITDKYYQFTQSIKEMVNAKVGGI